MMCLGATFSFRPPDWPVVLCLAALAALAWECLALALQARRLPWRRALPKLAIGAAMILIGGLLIYGWRTGGSIIVISAAAIAWTFRSYRQTTSPISSLVKRTFLTLRVACVLLLALWALRPIIQYEHEKIIPSVMLLGIDTSSSMQRRDMPNVYTMAIADSKGQPVRRIDSVRQAIQHQADNLVRLSEHGDLGIFNFAASAQPQALVPSRSKTQAEPDKDIFNIPDAKGEATALGDALAAAFNPYVAAGQDVSAIILISDGCNNTADVIDPLKEAELMGSRGLPIYAVAVGSDKVTQSTRALNVRDLKAPDEVEAQNRLPIVANIETAGLDGRQIKVTCKFDDEVIGSETYSATSAPHTSRFSHAPSGPGFHRLSVTAQCVGGGSLEGQMSASKLVHVFDRDLRVLYLEGRFRYEAKYIAEAITAGRRFSLDRRIVLSGGNAPASGGLSENIDDWIKYHAIILGDIEPSAFTPEQLEILKTLVSEKGKGLCMIGGSKSFGRGGWQNTPLADVLGVDLATSDQQIDMPVTIVPTEEGLKNEILHIGKDDIGGAAQSQSAPASGSPLRKQGDAVSPANTSPEQSAQNAAIAWAQLTALNGANRLGKPKLGATVLAANQQGEPMIVCQNYGSGRSLAIAFDTTWQWVLNPKDLAEYQRRFWRQVALYLASPRGNVWIGTDRPTYDLRRMQMGAEPIEVTAGVEDAFGTPAPQSLKEVTLTLTGSQPVPVSLQRNGDIFRTKLPPQSAAGLYVLNITAELAGKTLTAEHRFEVVQRDLEGMEALANFALLRQMAQASGGRFVTLSELPALLKDLRQATRSKKRVEVSQEDIAANLRWPIILILITLICLEWAMRKRRGLV